MARELVNNFLVSCYFWLCRNLQDVSVLLALCTSFTVFIIVKAGLKESRQLKCIFPFSSILRLNFSAARISRYYYWKMKSDKIFGILYPNNLSLVVKDLSIARQILDRRQTDSLQQIEPETLVSSVGKLFSASLQRRFLEEKRIFRGEANLSIDYALINECAKESLILLEAKANRICDISLSEYGLRVAYNVLGVTVFGKRATWLTNSRCDFYKACDQLLSMDDEQRVGIWKKFRRLFSDNDIDRTASHQCLKYFRAEVERCVNGKFEGNERCLMKQLIEPYVGMKNTVPDDIDYIAFILIVISLHSIKVISKMITVILYELSENKDVQNTLRQHLPKLMDDIGNPCLNSESLKDQTVILDNIIKESLRKHPIAAEIILTHSRPYSIPGTSFQLNQQVEILLPIANFQMDQSIYPSPTRFIPARFESATSLDNNIPQSVLNPFPLTELLLNGGHPVLNEFVETFTMVQVKCAVAYLIGQYEFLPAKAEANRSKYNAFNNLDNLDSFKPIVTVSSVENKNRSIIFLKSLNDWNHGNTGNIFYRALCRILS